MIMNKISASIPVGRTQTDGLGCQGAVPTGLIFTGSVVTGSQVSFLVSSDGTNYYPLYSATGTEVTLPVSACAIAYGLNYDTFKPWNFFKVRLGFSGSQKAQALYTLNMEFLLRSD